MLQPQIDQLYAYISADFGDNGLELLKNIYCTRNGGSGIRGIILTAMHIQYMSNMTSIHFLQYERRLAELTFTMRNMKI